jgi:hypothetical protein
MSMIVRVAEYLPKSEVDRLLRGRRGIYALFRKRGASYNVVYVGLARKGGIRARLRAHRRDAKKGRLWSHFSVFEVSLLTTDAQIAELEGLLRHIYRRDRQANRLNVQRGYGPLKRVRQDDLSAWFADLPQDGAVRSRGDDADEIPAEDEALLDRIHKEEYAKGHS